MKIIGSTVATVGGEASTTEASKGYESIRIPANTQRVFSLEDSETFEKKIIDIRAPNADAQIRASGTGWKIRDIGVRGSADRSGPHPPGKNADGYANLISASGIGVIDHVYLGDGVSGDFIRKGAIGVPRSHTGHIQIKRVNMSGWTGNAVYAGGAAATEEPNGTIAVDHCLLRNNNISHLRIATDGSSISNSVIYNTNQVPIHPLFDGVVNSRGIYDGYGTEENTITIKNCQIDCTNDNTNGGSAALVADHTIYLVRDSQVKGELIGNIDGKNVGGNPHHQIPSNVPMSAMQATEGRETAQESTNEMRLKGGKPTNQDTRSERPRERGNERRTKKRSQLDSPSNIVVAGALFSSLAVGLYSVLEFFFDSG